MSRAWQRASRCVFAVARGSRCNGARSMELKAETVYIPEQRLNEFLSAELSYLSAQHATPVSLRQILEAAQDASQRQDAMMVDSSLHTMDLTQPSVSEKLSLRELPIRFAHRVAQIEEIVGWQSVPDLVEARDLYFRAFCELRRAAEDRDLFKVAMTTLRQRNQNVLPLVMEGMQVCLQTGILDEAAINHWLERFNLARMGTRMIASQYLACIDPKRTGIVLRDCNPADVCQQAARAAKMLAQQHFCDNEIDVKINVVSLGSDGQTIKFTYIPQYLFYMVLELLKNSVRATVEVAQRNQSQIQEKPITVTVSANAHQVAVRIQDLAGGIPFESQHRVWSYMYSTSRSRSDKYEHQGTPLAGFGVGLPLSRLYAHHLGGSLHLMSMPGEGTSAFLYLKRLGEDVCEELPSSLAESYPS